MTEVSSEAELAEAIKETHSPLRVLGGGTRPIGGPIQGTPLSTRKLTGVHLYEPGALTIVVAAGTPVEEVEAVLATEGQRLPFEPMDHQPLLGTEGTPTIGGVVAANVSGPRRVQAGACRDSLIGVRFVEGNGAVVKNGGRVMKNVTGYDLVKLMAGSWGMLGVLTEVAFKVLAQPETEVTLVCEELQPSDSVAALSRALGSPYDVTGAAHIEGRTCVRLEGMASSVAYRKDRLLADQLQGFQALESADSAALWCSVRDVAPFAGAGGAVWRISVRPSDGPALVAQVGAAGVETEAVYDWGGGLVWLRVNRAADQGASAIRQAVATLGGHATLVRPDGKLPGGVPAFQPESPGVAALTAGLRAKFDPRGILNPGIMG